MPELLVPVSEKDHMRGRPDAEVTLVEYGDFASPDCVQAFHTIQEVSAHFAMPFRFVYRHFLLLPINPNAKLAALAAEAAAAEGKFWEMHDIMYERELMSPTMVETYARAIGLDEARFAEALEKETYWPRVESDMTSGVQSGVVVAPTLFVNGVEHEGVPTYHTLTRAIERALAAVGIRDI